MATGVAEGLKSIGGVDVRLLREWGAVGLGPRATVLVAAGRDVDVADGSGLGCTTALVFVGGIDWKSGLGWQGIKECLGWHWRCLRSDRHNLNQEHHRE